MQAVQSRPQVILTSYWSTRNNTNLCLVTPREAERNRIIMVEKQDKISNLGKEMEDLERHNDQQEIKLRQSLTTVNDLTR